MGDKFRQAWRLFTGHFGLVLAVTLSVMAPVNLIVNALSYYVLEADDLSSYWCLTSLAETVAGPLCAAALIFAFARSRRGELTTFGEAMAGGARVWFKVIVAWIIPGILMALGLVALIVPGVVLAVRYALITPVVVLEEDVSIGQARHRSTALVRGVGWQLFAAALLSFLAVMAFAALAGVPALWWDAMWISWVGDCAIDVAFAFVTALLFVYYADAVERERQTASPGDVPLAEPVPPPIVPR
jgi:hypothetical protein